MSLNSNSNTTNQLRLTAETIVRGLTEHSSNKEDFQVNVEYTLSQLFILIESIKLEGQYSAADVIKYRAEPCRCGCIPSPISEPLPTIVKGEYFVLLEKLINYIRDDQCPDEHFRGESTSEIPCHCCHDFLTMANLIAKKAGIVDKI